MTIEIAAAHATGVAHGVAAGTALAFHLAIRPSARWKSF